MKLTCPHCSQNLELEPDVLAALQGQPHFACPACEGAISVPAEQAVKIPAKQATIRRVPAQSKRRAYLKLVALAAALVAVAVAYFLLAPPTLKTTQRIEAEDMRVVNLSAGKIDLQNMAEFRAASWSGGKQLHWMNDTDGATLKLALPVTIGGKVRLRAVLTRSWDYGKVEVLIDGHAVAGSPFDLNNRADRLVTVTNLLDWGVHDLTAGEHEIDFTVSHGAQPKDCHVGLDFILIEPPTGSMEQGQSLPLAELFLGDWSLRIGSYNGTRGLRPDGTLMVNGKQSKERDDRWRIDETHLTLQYGLYYWERYDLPPDEKGVLNGKTHNGVATALSR